MWKDKPTWKRLVRRACWPSYRCGGIVLAWVAMWIYVLVGAAIFQAIENSTRSTQLAIDSYQPPLNYVEAIYFTETVLSTCGFGDYVPVTDGGRGFLYVWAFFGCGLWALMIAAVVGLVYEWILFSFLLYPWWAAKGKDPVEKESEVKSMEVFSWKAVLTLVFIALSIYFAIHVAGAGILLAIEPSLGNYQETPYFPNNLGGAVYFTITSSQTICLGGDYLIKTDAGMAFYLVWHSFALFASAFLFSTAAITLLKWFNGRIFQFLEKAIRKVNAKRMKRKRKPSDASEVERSETAKSVNV